MIVRNMEEFDFKDCLEKHPDVTSLKELDLSEIPARSLYLKDQLSRCFLVVVSINSLKYELFIGEPKKFPEKLPWFFLFHPEQHDFHNHVNFKGDICYTVKSDGMFINVDHPKAVVEQALGLVINVLNGSTDRNLQDLFEEFEGYWQSLPGNYLTRCFLTPSSNLERITALCDPKSKQRIIPHTFYKEPLSKQYGYNSKLKQQQSRKAWYLPLEKARLPPDPDAGLTPTYLRRLLNSVSDTHRSTFLRTLEKQKKKGKNKSKRYHDFLLFSQMRPSGALALFGVAISGISNAPFFLSSNDEGWKLTPLRIQRHYQDYLLERGGAETSLQDKTVAVIGCGAVGSRVVEQLTLAGVRKLLVLDHDTLSEDNIYRHVLGGRYIGDNKAKAMAEHLKKRLPYVQIVPKAVKSEEWFQKEEWKTVDIIVDATADFTRMREINKQVVKSPQPIPIVYCWLEPCSVGGHSVLVDGVSKGCLECFFDFAAQGPQKRCSFLKPYQNVTKDLTGCGGAFTPFSSLDAIKTATLATELILEQLLKKQTTSYRFWVGHNDIAKSAGLETTAWYKKAVHQNVAETEKGFCKKHCSVCGRRN